MPLSRHLVVIAAVAVAVLSVPPDAHAWGGYRYGHGHHHGFGRYYGYRHRYGHPSYGYGRPYYGYGRPYYGYGHRHDSGRGDAASPAYPPRTQTVPPAPASEQPDGCREFTRTIVIDGEEQTAYGTACRQSDGSWKIVN